MDDSTPYYGAPVGNQSGNSTYQPQRPRVSPPPKKRGVGRRLLGLLIVIISIFILYQSALMPMLMNNMTPYRIYPQEATFTMQRTITLTGSGTYNVDFPEPMNISNAQEVQSIKFGPYPDRQERYGVKWDVWKGSFGISGLDDRKILIIHYTLHTYTLVWDMDTSGSPSMIPSDIRNTYTGDEWELLANDTSLDTADRDGDGRPDVMMQPSAPEISSLAHNLTDDKPDVYSKAKAIYDYMHANFRYSTDSEMEYVQQQYGGLPKHALATLRDGWGDCDEQSMLFISLLRAVDIPARIEMGMLYDQSMDTWGGHAWAQLYIPDQQGGGGWYNVDIVNSEFLMRDCNRMTTWVDDGNGRHLSDYYHIYRGSGSIEFEERDTSVSYSSSGEVHVHVDPANNSIPGFGALSVPSALAITLILRKKRI